MLRGNRSNSARMRNDRVPPIRNYTIDLTVLNDDEQRALNRVIEKDLAVCQALDQRVTEIRREIQMIRKAGALRPGDKQNRICARCKFSFWPGLLSPVRFLDAGARCVNCKFRVCRKCRFRQANNQWLCSLCLKQRQEKWLTGEWLSGGSCKGLVGSDLLRASLRDRAHFMNMNVFQKFRKKVQRTHANAKKEYEGETSIDGVIGTTKLNNDGIETPNTAKQVKELKNRRKGTNQNHGELSTRTATVINTALEDCPRKCKEFDKRMKYPVKEVKNKQKKIKEISQFKSQKPLHGKRKFESISELEMQGIVRPNNYPKKVNRNNILHIDSNTTNCNVEDFGIKTRGRTQNRRWKNKHRHQDRSHSTERQKQRDKLERLKDKQIRKKYVKKQSNSKHKKRHLISDSTCGNWNKKSNVHSDPQKDLTENQIDRKIGRPKIYNHYMKYTCSKNQLHNSTKEAVTPNDNYHYTESHSEIAEHDENNSKSKACSLKLKNEPSKMGKKGVRKKQLYKDLIFNTQDDNAPLNSYEMDENYNFTPKTAKDLKASHLAKKKKKAEEKKKKDLAKKRKEKQKKEAEAMRKKKKEAGKGFGFLQNLRKGDAIKPPPKPPSKDADDDGDDNDEDEEDDDDDNEVDDDKDKDEETKPAPGIANYIKPKNRGQGAGDTESVASQTWQRHKGGWHAWLCPFCRLLCEFGREFG